MDENALVSPTDAVVDAAIAAVAAAQNADVVAFQAGVGTAPFDAAVTATIAALVAAQNADNRRTYGAADDADNPEILEARMAQVAQGTKADYANPNFTAPQQHTVEDGRVFGHLALWGTKHSGSGRTPPRNPGTWRYARATVLSDGTEVKTYPLLLGDGHTSHDVMGHFNQPEQTIADVAIGEDEHGIWYSGRLRETWRGEPVTDEVAARFAGISLSGVWHMTGEDEGEILGADAVGLPAYPIDSAVLIADFQNFDPVVPPLVAYAAEMVSATRYNTEQRRELAERGEARPDGSFPIVDLRDLRNAIQSVGRASDVAAARRWIVRRARELDLVDELPEHWQARFAREGEPDSEHGNTGPTANENLNPPSA